MFFCPPPFMKVGGASTPLIRAVLASTPINDNRNNHPVIMPTNLAGDLLLMLVAQSSGSNRSPNTPSGWSSLGPNTTAVGTLRWMDVFYKTSSGSEPSSVTVTSSGNGQWAAITYALSDWTGTPELTAIDGEATANPDPDSLVPSWGTASALSIVAIAAQAASQPTISVSSTGYSSTTDFIPSSADSVHMFSQSLLRADTPHDPSAWTFTGVVNSMRTTIAVRGA